MKTLALVIGNNDYFGNAKLDNAVNDAKAISEVFERLGFEVIYKENIASNDCGEILTNFETKVKQFDASIFYFSGHGLESEGENYLISVDCQILNNGKHYFDRTCIRLSEITSIAKKTQIKQILSLLMLAEKALTGVG